MLGGQSGVCFLAVVQQLALHGCLDQSQIWGTWTAGIFCQCLVGVATSISLPHPLWLPG